MIYKRIISYLLFISLFFVLFSIAVSAHPGRTDSNGGHSTDSGGYHYHHGYPAHEHTDMDGDGKKDCPYDFHDITDHSNKYSSGNNTVNKKYYEDYCENSNSTIEPEIKHPSFGSMYWSMLLNIATFGLSITSYFCGGMLIFGGLLDLLCSKIFNTSDVSCTVSILITVLNYICWHSLIALILTTISYLTQ